jgi:hypothetical protein
MGIASAFRDQASHRASRHATHRLHQHLQVETIFETPLDLADIVTWKCPQKLGHALRCNLGHGTVLS